MSVQGNASDEASSNLPGMETADSNLAIDETLITVKEEELFPKMAQMNIESEVSKADVHAVPSVHFLPETGTKPKILPSNTKCTVLNQEKLPQLSKWDIFKSKMYLGAAYGGTRMAANTDTQNDPGEGCSKEDNSKPANVEGLGARTSQTSSKPISWAKMKGVFKRKVDKSYMDLEDEGVQDEMMPKKFSVGWFQSAFRGKEIAEKKPNKEEDEDEDLPGNTSNCPLNPEC